MISNSFLFQNLALPLFSNDPVETRTRLAHDRIFAHLIDQNILHENGSLNLNFAHLPPILKESQLERLNALLKNTFTIKSKDNHFEFSTSLEEIFRYLKIDNIEVVGGTVFYILGREYMEELIRYLQIPEELLSADFFAEFEKPAADIDIRIPCNNPADYKDKMCAFYETKVTAEQKKYIQEAGFTKLYIHPDYFPDKFSTISFGNRQDFSVDLLFVKSLKRKNLFKHDALYLNIFDLKSNTSTVILGSNHQSFLESLILKLTKTLSADEPQEIDQMGCSMLFSYLTKGWRCCSENLQETLISKFLQSRKFDLLPKVISNHFPEDPFAASVLCFNTCQALPETEIPSVVRALITPFEKIEKSNPVAKLLHDSMALIIGEKAPAQVFSMITACFHLFGAVLSFEHANVLNIKVKRVTIKEAAHLEFKFLSSKALHLVIKDDLTASFQVLKNTVYWVTAKTQEQIFAIFNCLNDALVIDSETSFQKTDSTCQHYLTVAFALLEMEETSLKNLGFYLLCSIDKEENTEKHFPVLIKHFLQLILNEKSIAARKNLLRSLAGYGISEIEGFEKTISQVNIKPNEIMKAFCLNFAKIDSAGLTQEIVKIWETHPELFNEQSNVNLAEKLAVHNPRVALKIARKIKKTKPIIDSILRWYLDSKNKIYLLRDIDNLSDAVHQVILQMTKYPAVPKQEEVVPYLRCIQALLEIDFAKGLQLYEALKSKNAITKGFAQIVGLTAPEKRWELAIKLNETSPIDFNKTNSPELEERLESFFGCISDGDNSGLLQEIISFLKKVLTIKNFSASNNFKNSLKPKFVWILTAVLNECDTADALAVYFKLADAFDPGIIISKELLVLLCKKLEALMQVENLSFTREALNKLSKNHKNITSEELRLYELLAESALHQKLPEISEEFLKKIHAHSKAVNTRLFNELLQFYIKNQNILSAFNLVNFFGESAQIADEAAIWKCMVLNLPENKKQDILLKKSPLFLSDAEIVTEAQKITRSLLKTAEIAKGKAIEESFKSALVLIETYRLTDLIEELAQTLIKMNHKALTKQTFSTLQKINVPLYQLIPIYKILSTLVPEIYADFLNQCGLLLERFEGNPSQKQEFTIILFSGFITYLNHKSANPSKILPVYRFLENEIRTSDPLSSGTEIKFAFQFIRSFSGSLKVQEINNAFWERMNELSSRQDLNQEQLKELVIHFARAVGFCAETELHIENMGLYLSSISCKIADQLIPSTILFVLEPLMAANTQFSLDLCGCIIVRTLETLSFEGDEVQIPLKEFVKKLIKQSIEKNVYTHLMKFVETDLFTKKETALFYGMCTKTFFNDPETIHNETKISMAFAALNVHIVHTPNEAIKFLKDHATKVVNHLIATLSIHSNVELYKEIHLQLVKAFQSYMDNNAYFNFVDLITGGNPGLQEFEDQEDLEYISEETVKDMQRTFYALLGLFTTTLSAKVYKEEMLFTESIQCIAMNNIIHIHALTKLIPEKKDTILCAMFDYCCAATRLEAKYFNEAKIVVRSVLLELMTDGFFKELQNDQSILHSTQIVVFLKLGVYELKGPAFQALKALTAKNQALHILDFLSKILYAKKCDPSLNSFIVAYDYYTEYLPILKAGNSKKANQFYIDFVKQFKLQFPAYASDPIKYLDEAVEIRHKTPPINGEPNQNASGEF